MRYIAPYPRLSAFNIQGKVVAGRHRIAGGLCHDFTLSLYHRLIGKFKAQGYLIQPDAGNRLLHQKSIILRHDIDALPLRALAA